MKDGDLIPVAELPPLLERCRDGHRPTTAEVAVMLGARGRDLQRLALAADGLRKVQVGDAVTYVVNRNINFTNVCVKTCHFCAFSRDLRSEEGYLLPVAEVVRRAQEAWDLGATEVCLQAGLTPEVGGREYLALLEAVKAAVPDMHVHAFSPAELSYGARRARMSVGALLSALKAAGLGSVPGTSAEVLDDGVRRRISPGRIPTQRWVEIIREAHDQGIPTTSTLMFGHVETREQIARHLLRLRELQRATGGFTEFVPLSFVHTEAPLFARSVGARPGPTADEVVALFATARVALGWDIPNLQVSWVKQGLPFAQRLLSCGANDLGGTLMNESISTAAGAAHGQLATPERLRALIRGAGRVPAQRTTLYGRVQAQEAHTLDRVQPERFGSYRGLSRGRDFRYARAPRR